MVLRRTEIEIPLNGGMDTQSSAEFQPSSTLRLVQDLQINRDGEWEKRPTWDATTTESVDAPSGFPYADKVSGDVAKAGTVFTLGSQVGVLSDQLGILRKVECYTDSGGTVVAESRLDTIKPAYTVGNTVNYIGYPLQGCEVKRRFVASTPESKAATGLTRIAAASYGDVDVSAWITADSAGVGTLRLTATNRLTGAVVTREVTQTLSTASYVNPVHAIEYREAGYEGVLIAYMTGNPAVAGRTVKCLLWDARTSTFIQQTDLTAVAVNGCIALAQNGTTGFYFGFANNTSGVMNVETRTLAGGVSATHVALSQCDRGISIVKGAVNTLIVSAEAATQTMFAEVLGAPANVITVKALAGSQNWQGVYAALEARSAINEPAIICGNALDGAAAAVPASYLTMYFGIDFTTTTPALYMSEQWVYSSLCIGATYSRNRAYFAHINFEAVYSNQIKTIEIARVQYMEVNNFQMTPIARVGHQRATTLYLSISPLPSCLSTRSDGVITCAFTADLGKDKAPFASYVLPQTGFVATVDTRRAPVPWCEAQGTTLLGGGMLHAYDGLYAFEHQPLNRPEVYPVENGVGTLNGTYGFAAIYTFTDKAGNIHRSRPAFKSIAVVNKVVDVYVARPTFTGIATFTGEYEIGCELYATEAGGTDYYLVNNTGVVDVYDTTVWSAFVFQNVAAGSSADPAIYTNAVGGYETPSDPAPACHSLAVIGDRVWLLDSEDRSRVWFSKPLVAGYAPEWSVANTLFVGDECVGITDVQGIPTVFGRNGIWQIYGEGPDNLAVGAFAPARRLPHEVECLHALSLCKTTLGVLFRARRGVCLLGNDLSLQPVGHQIDQEIKVSGNPAGYSKIVYHENTDNAHVLDFAPSDLPLHYVLHMGEGKWSSFQQQYGDQAWVDAVSSRGQLWFLSAGTVGSAHLRRLLDHSEAGYASDTSGWSLKTPWYRFGSLNGLQRIWEMQIALRLAINPANCGGITVTYEMRDSSLASESVTWSGAELAALGGTDDVVTLRVHPAVQIARAFRVTITEAGGTAYAGCVPLALRVIGGALEWKGKSGSLKSSVP